MKAPDAFRTISEVAEDLDLPQHVLRFWETRFTQIKPMKRGGGRRYYRPEDVDLLRGIRLLLYSEGFTIRGVQRLLKEKGLGFVVSVGQTGSAQPPTQSIAGFAPEPSLGKETTTQSPSESRQTAYGAAIPVLAGRAGLSKDSRRKMESVLAELVEAKRLLDQAR